jgi:hypothetical protein
MLASFTFLQGKYPKKKKKKSYQTLKRGWENSISATVFHLLILQFRAVDSTAYHRTHEHSTVITGECAKPSHEGGCTAED